ncbi:MAG: hypothetical protein LBF28_02110, partial [Rickettsiales bacterium]|nr:hypothetical protein [Rickettsiales bacterium]
LASKLSDVSKKIKKAKTVQTIGAVASVGSAVTSGVQNINAVGEKKGLNLASDITAGTAAIASGVGIALAASANKTIFDAEKKLFDCMEYLWWDENEHTYAAQLKPEKCSAGQKLVDNKCIDCYQKNNRVGYVDPGVTCKPICEKFYQPRDDGAFDWACVYVGITSSADYVEYCQNKATKESCELLFNGQDVNEKFKDTLNMTNGTTGVVDDLTSAKSKLQSYMDGIAKQYGSAGGAYCKLDSGKYLVYAGYDNKHGSLQRSGPSLSGTMGICFWNGGKCITNTFIDDSGGHWNPEMPSNCISAYGI